MIFAFSHSDKLFSSLVWGTFSCRVLFRVAIIGSRGLALYFALEIYLSISSAACLGALISLLRLLLELRLYVITLLLPLCIFLLVFALGVRQNSYVCFAEILVFYLFVRVDSPGVLSLALESNNSWELFKLPAYLISSKMISLLLLTLSTFSTLPLFSEISSSNSLFTFF